MNVTAIAPLRDVQPQSLAKMISTLTDWETRCGEVVRDLEEQIEGVKSRAAKRAAKEAEYQAAFEKGVVERKKEIANTEGAGASHPGRRKEGSAFRRALGMGNKREAEDIEGDDGFFDSGEGMDIDEGAGRGIGSRTKRMLGGRKA